jgi:hypothetical protein
MAARVWFLRDNGLCCEDITVKLWEKKILIRKNHEPVEIEASIP